MSPQRLTRISTEYKISIKCQNELNFKKIIKSVYKTFQIFLYPKKIKYCPKFIYIYTWLEDKNIFLQITYYLIRLDKIILTSFFRLISFPSRDTILAKRKKVNIYNKI